MHIGNHKKFGNDTDEQGTGRAIEMKHTATEERSLREEDEQPARNTAEQAYLTDPI